MTLADQARQYDSLRADGATPAEAILTLSAIDEVDRTIELVGPKGYVHGWKYVGEGQAPTSSESRRIMKLQAKRRAEAETHGDVRQRMSAAMQEPPSSPVSRALVSQEEAQQIANVAVAKSWDTHRKQLLAEAKAANEKFEDAKSRGEDRRRLKTLAWHGGFIAAGGIMTAIEAKLGTPGIFEAATMLGPQLLQEAVDVVKKLS